jgi:hypothetical protein
VPARSSSLGKNNSVDEQVGRGISGEFSSIQSVSILKEDQEFNKMIDDMVVKVWKCSRCFSMLHETKDCVNEIRCRACYNYGHIQRNCLKTKDKECLKWVQKRPNKNAVLMPAGELSNSAISPPLSYTRRQAEKQSISPSSSNPKPPPDPISSESPAAASIADGMAVFEVEPTPWLPWGHQVIDGGNTRLPRSYYYACQDPTPQHQAFCIASVKPAPPPQDAAFWRQQVSNFLVGPLQRNVVDVQPSLFGVGLFQLSNANAVHALVQHGQYQLNHQRFVRFIYADNAAQNHCASLGFRKGWLMFLGIPPDYRNDFDISNAVSSFGKFHYWNHQDPITERALVFASFPSPQLVPRDVVFAKFASVGGVKESWTAPVFILSADFADALPADEDQMPPDGNPHPLPGNL